MNKKNVFMLYFDDYFSGVNKFYQTQSNFCRILALSNLHTGAFRQHHRSSCGGPWHHRHRQAQNRGKRRLSGTTAATPLWRKVFKRRSAPAPQQHPEGIHIATFIHSLRWRSQTTNASWSRGGGAPLATSARSGGHGGSRRAGGNPYSDKRG